MNDEKQLGLMQFQTERNPILTHRKKDRMERCFVLVCSPFRDGKAFPFPPHFPQQQGDWGLLRNISAAISFSPKKSIGDLGRIPLLLCLYKAIRHFVPCFFSGCFALSLNSAWGARFMLAPSRLVPCLPAKRSSDR